MSTHQDRDDGTLPPKTLYITVMERRTLGRSGWVVQCSNLGVFISRGFTTEPHRSWEGFPTRIELWGYVSWSSKCLSSRHGDPSIPLKLHVKGQIWCVQNMVCARTGKTEAGGSVDSLASQPSLISEFSRPIRDPVPKA